MELLKFYNERIADFSAKIKKCEKKEKILPFYRLLIVVLGIVFFIFLLKISIVISALVLITSLFGLAVLVNIDNHNSELKKYYELLVELNENEIKTLQGEFPFVNDGSKYFDEFHPYSYDLDIFGKSSLFHFLNRTNLSRSSDVLAAWLLKTANNNEIVERNKAVVELSKKINWRQKIFTLGFSAENSEKSLSTLEAWVKKKSHFNLFRKYSWVCTFLSALTITSFAMAYVFPTILIAFFLLLIHFIIIRQTNLLVRDAHNDVSNYSKVLDSYSNILKEIENESFKSYKLNALKERLKMDDSTASGEIKKISKILHNFDIRYNALVHAILNNLFFWDIHQYYRLEKWKLKNQKIEQWFDVVGEFESLSSLANMHFNNPDWCFAKMDESYFQFEAKTLGHPLIKSENRVCNDFLINGVGKLVLLTGSNMSGKSTFLRSVGINMVLAMAGSCVCATEFRCSLVNILSSMRIVDSLQDNTSTFFAELKKLEFILQKVERNEQVFILLDEPLRGTNSNDKHIGTSALIRQFVSNNTVGIIATHDLSLTDLANDYPENVENYNFDIKVENENLFFDYKLNQGVCTSLNASLLMKKIGIKI